MIVENLLQFGLNDKEVSVYLSLIALGPSPVRVIAKAAAVNRGTTYDILNKLTELGIVTEYRHPGSDEKRQYFVAEPPQKLIEAVDQKRRSLENLKIQFSKDVPELEAMYERSGVKPVVKYYEGTSGVRMILRDVLEVMKNEKDRTYYVYSSADIRDYLYKAYEDFNEDRIANKIFVKAISIGSGGELAGLDERKWLSRIESSPTYVLIYNGKLALISVGASGRPVGVIIENEGLYKTQEMIFNKLWQTL